MGFSVFNIETVQNAYYTKSFIWQVDGVAVSWDGYHVAGQIRSIPGDRLLVDLAELVEIEPEPPEENRGRFVLTLPADVTKNLLLVSAWDLFAVADNDPKNATPLLAGKVLCERSVTSV